MSDAGGMHLKVKTEQLATAADEMERQLNQMRKKFRDIDKIVKRSSSYWEADGQKIYFNKYNAKTDSIENILKGFEANVTNLRTIAGLYVATETSASEATQVLSEDVII